MTTYLTATELVDLIGCAPTSFVTMRRAKWYSPESELAAIIEAPNV